MPSLGKSLAAADPADLRQAERYGARSRAVGGSDEGERSQSAVFGEQQYLADRVPGRF